VSAFGNILPTENPTGEIEIDGDCVVMYRPTGARELALVEASGSRRWPPRLIDQPIFYPVTNAKYAEEISARWNVKDSGIGYVTRFKVRKGFVDRYQVQKVGGAHHTEWWIPAEDLNALNDEIIGTIEVIATYRADPDTSAAA
jgi:hypothetical protein